MSESPQSIKEGDAQILKTSQTFYNPAQVVNRDLSVAAIAAFSDILNDPSDPKYKKFARRTYNLFKPREKPENEIEIKNEIENEIETEIKNEIKNEIETEIKNEIETEIKTEIETKIETKTNSTPRDNKLEILDALSASGIRAIRYAKELSHVQRVTANDLSSEACKLINQNIALNELDGDTVTVTNRDAMLP